MEHIMQFGACRKFQSVCDLVDDGSDAVGAVEAGAQLALGGALK